MTTNLQPLLKAICEAHRLAETGEPVGGEEEVKTAVRAAEKLLERLRPLFRDGGVDQELVTLTTESERQGLNDV